MADDFSELYELAADLGTATAKTAPNIRKAIEYTARGIKDAAGDTANRTGLSGYAASIDYDIEIGSDGVEAEIGPNLGKRQGSFGFVEDGGGGVRSAPQHALRDALKDNEADFYKGLEIALRDGLDEAVGQ